MREHIRRELDTMLLTEPLRWQPKPAALLTALTELQGPAPIPDRTERAVPSIVEPDHHAASPRRARLQRR